MAIFSCEHEVTNNVGSPDETMAKGSIDHWAVILAGGDGTRFLFKRKLITREVNHESNCSLPRKA
jgi:hypothetical protein